MQILNFDKHSLDTHIQQSSIHYCYMTTPAGLLLVLSTATGIFKTEFVEHEVEFPGWQRVPTITTQTFLVTGTAFQLKVWQALTTIACGTKKSYQELAQLIGAPKAYRAVGNAVGANPVAYFIPCHRIVRGNGNLGGYAWGIERKKALLAAE